ISRRRPRMRAAAGAAVTAAVPVIARCSKRTVVAPSLPGSRTRRVGPGAALVAEEGLRKQARCFGSPPPLAGEVDRAGRGRSGGGSVFPLPIPPPKRGKEEISALAIVRRGKACRLLSPSPPRAPRGRAAFP